MNLAALAFRIMLGLVPVTEAPAEQAAIMAAESITWDCTTDGECFAACVKQGMPEQLCSDWSYNSSGYEGRTRD